MGALTVLNPSLPQRTTSLLRSRATEARGLLSRPTTPKQAADAAKRLVGNFPNLKPDDPARFIASLADILGDYPLGLVEECCDPRGLAKRVEFLSIKSLTGWMDTRLEFYQSLAGWQDRVAPARPELSEAECGKGLLAFRGMLMTLATEGAAAAKAMTFDQAAEVGAADLRVPVRLMAGAGQSIDAGKP